jgi:hypothetical protein
VDGVVDYAASGQALVAIDPVGELHASGGTEIWYPEEDRFIKSRPSTQELSDDDSPVCLNPVVSDRIDSPLVPYAQLKFTDHPLRSRAVAGVDDNRT